MDQSPLRGRSRAAADDERGRPLEIRHDAFAWEALEAEAKRQGETIEELIADACGYLAAEIESERAAVRLPRFARRTGGEVRELALPVPERTWQVLMAQAEVQRADLARMVEHASLLYLADLDSGLATRRILEGDDAEG